MAEEKLSTIKNEQEQPLNRALVVINSMLIIAGIVVSILLIAR